MSSPKRILVTMSTGHQGSAAVKALSKRNKDGANVYDILAVTRNAQSSKSKALAALPGVTIIESDYDPKTIFEKASKDGPIYGVVSIQSFMKGMLPKHVPAGVEGETVLGKEVADVAAQNSVKHFVYQSVDQGGLPKTNVPHFESKRLIEEHILTTHKEDLPSTIIRPPGFMEMISNGDDFMGRIVNTLFVTTVKRPLKMIASSDIGEFVALAFDKPQEYLGKQIEVAGDEITPEQMNDVYKQAKGKNLPTTFHFIPQIFLATSKEFRTMFQFINKNGFAADISAMRKLNPEMKTYKDYVEQDL